MMLLPSLRYYRNRAGLWQKDLAKLAQCNVQTITRLEAGTPARQATADRLATALGVPLEQLTQLPPWRQTAMTRPKGWDTGLCASCWWNLWLDEHSEHAITLCLTPDGRSACKGYRSQAEGLAIESGQPHGEAAR